MLLERKETSLGGNDMERIKKSKFLLIVLLIIQSIVVLNSYRIIPVNIHCNALQFIPSEKGNEKHIDIVIEGAIKKHLFKEDYASLKLKIGDMNYPDTERHKHIFPHRFSGTISRNGEVAFKGTEYVENDIRNYFKEYYTVSMMYRFYSSDRVKYPPYDWEISADCSDYGYIYIGKNLQTFMIYKYIHKIRPNGWRSSSSSDDSSVIISAKDRKTADDMLNKFNFSAKHGFKVEY